jgi:dihydrofolate reductase
MNMPFDLLLGRKTFEIWSLYWPHHGDEWPGVNAATKYVASNSMTSSAWQASVFLNGDIAEKIARIKQQQGPDLNVWGSGKLIQTLIKHDLARLSAARLRISNTSRARLPEASAKQACNPECQ